MEDSMINSQPKDHLISLTVAIFCQKKPVAQPLRVDQSGLKP